MARARHQLQPWGWGIAGRPRTTLDGTTQGATIARYREDVLPSGVRAILQTRQTRQTRRRRGRAGASGRMPKIVSDIVDTYLFRTFNSRPQFLVLRCKPDAPSGVVWHAIHSKIEPGESAVDASRRDILRKTSLTPVRFYTADYIGQFYDHISDTIVLAPTLAAQIGTRARITLSADYVDYAWCDLEETTARLVWSAHRWAVRHVFDIIAMGGEEAEIYAI